MATSTGAPMNISKPEGTDYVLASALAGSFQTVNDYVKSQQVVKTASIKAPYANANGITFIRMGNMVTCVMAFKFNQMPPDAKVTTVNETIPAGYRPTPVGPTIHVIAPVMWNTASSNYHMAFFTNGTIQVEAHEGVNVNGWFTTSISWITTDVYPS
jgi:hypothetical protein